MVGLLFNVFVRLILHLYILQSSLFSIVLEYRRNRLPKYKASLGLLGPRLPWWRIYSPVPGLAESSIAWYPIKSYIEISERSYKIHFISISMSHYPRLKHWIYHISRIASTHKKIFFISVKRWIIFPFPHIKLTFVSQNVSCSRKSFKLSKVL